MEGRKDNGDRKDNNDMTQGRTGKKKDTNGTTNDMTRLAD
jgi:hypothetical protein